MRFSNLIACVRLFHEAFRLPVQDKPNLIGADRYHLRFQLMQEENKEYLQACEEGDIVEIADALGDQLYVLLGTMLEHGLQDKMERVFVEIQNSNMSKLDEHGNPIHREDGKVLKSHLFFPPDIKKILE